jgi:hypothetical protein
MTTTGRLQRYDHRLRNLVRSTGDVTIAMDLGVPRWTARGWLGKAPKVVVSLDVSDLKATELQQEVLELRRRVRKLTMGVRIGRLKGRHRDMPIGIIQLPTYLPALLPVTIGDQHAMVTQQAIGCRQGAADFA